MKKLLPLIICLSFIQNAKASFPEMFGASFTTRMIGHMSNLDSNDPSNNYYAPALLGFSHSVNSLLEATSTATHFKPIENVVITNSTNSNSSTPTYGNVRTDYSKFYGGGLHFGLPIGYPEKGTIGTLGLSIYLPIGSILETNSGNPFLPEYVMYRSRHQRTSVYLNFAHQSNEDLAWSFGAILGFQASAEVNTNLSLNGTTYGSWAQAKSKISPSLGAILSFAYKLNPASTTYFTYQQEMKSNLEAHATGEVNNPNLGLFDATIKSVIFYEPHTFKWGANYKFTDLEIFGGFEYQMWSNYKQPTIDIIKNGGTVSGSANYEKTTTQNTFNPRFGARYHFTNRITLAAGASYRPTPLKGNFSGSGNSIDVDTYVFSTGLTYRMVIWSKDVTIGPSLEYHHLKDKTITKTTNTESGTAGVKLGSPSYNVGGYILSAAMGVKFNF